MSSSERVEIVISSDVAGPVLVVDGVAVELASGQDPELAGIGLVATEAVRRGRPVPAVVIGDGGSWRWRVLVHPDGTATDDLDDVRNEVAGRPAAGRIRRARSRLALAAIVVVVGLVGIAAIAVGSTAGQARIATGEVGAVPTPVAVPSTVRTPAGARLPAETTGSVPPAAPPAVAPDAVAGAAPRAVAPRAVRPTPGRPSAKAPERAAEAVQPAPVTPAAAVGRGVVISDGAGLCVSAGADGPTVRASACDSSAAQQWTATAEGELRQGARCLVTRSGVAVLDCAAVSAAARTWTPTRPKPGLVNAATGLCLVATGSKVFAAQCGTGRSLAIT